MYSLALNLYLVLDCTWAFFPFCKNLLFGLGLKDKASLFLVGLSLHFPSTYNISLAFNFYVQFLIFFFLKILKYKYILVYFQ